MQVLQWWIELQLSEAESKLDKAETIEQRNYYMGYVRALQLTYAKLIVIMSTQL